MNERSKQFHQFVTERMQTRAYRRVERWVTIRLWFYRLFKK